MPTKGLRCAWGTKTGALVDQSDRTGGLRVVRALSCQFDRLLTGTGCDGRPAARIYAAVSD